ncbi:MAG: Bro-N domain-containing protein [Bacteroides sp.]|nr:Bro-N domain-containing protein [Bacteroides sp.]
MTQNQALQLFGAKKIRSVWDSDTEEWYFSVVDIVAVLTDSVNPTDYLKKMRKRDEQLGAFLGTNCPQVSMTNESGKSRKTLAANMAAALRIIQSIPSPKAEPFKQWLAKVGSERLDEMADPEKAIDRGFDYYRRKGYSDKWIEQRMQGKTVRKELTDEWKRSGVKDSQFAMLTDILTKEWSGLTTREYKSFKGLKKENLRDHMTNLETAVNTLAEAFTTELSKKNNPRTIEQNKKVAKAGGSVAKETRIKMERQLGRSIISPANAKGLTSTDAPDQLPESDNE